MLLLITIDRCSAKAQPNSTVIAGTAGLYVRQANNNVSQKSIGKDANVIYTYNQKQPGRGCAWTYNFNLGAEKEIYVCHGTI